MDKDGLARLQERHDARRAQGRAASHGAHATANWAGQHQTVPLRGAAEPTDATPRRDGPLTLVGDVRVDDRAALAAIAPGAAGDVDGADDHQLVLAAYAAHGPDCLHHLVGEYAFSIWDDGKKRLFVARDPLGTRSIGWARSDAGALLAATHPADLMHLPGIDMTVDEAWIAHAVAPGLPPAPHTIARGVKTVLPGHWGLHAADGTDAGGRHWSPPRHRDLDLGGRDDYAVHLRDLIVAATTSAVADAGVAYGTQLSGGLDSSSLAIIAARALAPRGANLDGYGLVLPDDAEDADADDERDYMQVAADAADNLLFHPVASHLEAPEEHLDVAGGALAAPTLHAAAKDGAQVLLSGYGGDEFASYNGRWIMGQWARQRRYGKLIAEAWRQAKRYDRGFLGILYDKALHWDNEIEAGGIAARDLAAPLLAADFRARHGLDDWQAWTALSLLPHHDSGGMQWFLAENGHCGDRAVNDNNAAGTLGMEFRFPLMDRRIVEFALRVPVEMYLQNGWMRALYRYAMQDILPPEIQWRHDKRPPLPWGGQRTSWEAQRNQMMRRRLAEQAENGAAADLDPAIVAMRDAVTIEPFDDGAVAALARAPVGRDEGLHRQKMTLMSVSRAVRRHRFRVAKENHATALLA